MNKMVYCNLHPCKQASLTDTLTLRWLDTYLEALFKVGSQNLVI